MEKLAQCLHDVRDNIVGYSALFIFIMGMSYDVTAHAGFILTVLLVLMVAPFLIGMVFFLLGMILVLIVRVLTGNI